MSAMGQKRTSVSFDHFIRTQQECFRDFQSKHLGGGRIDDEVELDWLLDRQVCGLRNSQYFVGILGRAPKKIWEIWSVRHKSPYFKVLKKRKNFRQQPAKRHIKNPHAARDAKRTG